MSEPTRLPGRRIEHFCDGADKKRCRCRNKNRPRSAEYVRRDNLKRLYGMTLEQYDAMRVEQGYRCAICARHEDELPESRGGRPRHDGTPTATPPKLMVDHCHRGGQIRALLCVRCNTGLACFVDSPQVLELAIAYLRAGSADG